MTFSSHELPSLSKTSMIVKTEGSGNVTGLNSEIIVVLNLELAVQSKGPYLRALGERDWIIGWTKARGVSWEGLFYFTQTAFSLKQSI